LQEFDDCRVLTSAQKLRQDSLHQGGLLPPCLTWFYPAKVLHTFALVSHKLVCQFSRLYGISDLGWQISYGEHLVLKKRFP